MTRSKTEIAKGRLAWAATVLVTAGACNADDVTPFPEAGTGWITIGDDGPPMVTTNRPDDGPSMTSSVDDGPWGTTWGGEEVGTTFLDGDDLGDADTTTGVGTSDSATDASTSVATSQSGTTSFGTTDFSTTDFSTTDFSTTDFSATDAGTDTGGPLSCIEVDLGNAVGPAVATGTTLGADDDLAQNCGGANGPDVVYRWTPPNAGTWTFDTNGSSYDTVLTLFHACDDGAPFACNDDAGNGLNSLIVADLEQDQSVLIVVEGFGNGAGPFQLNIDGEIVDPGTSSGGDPLDAFQPPQPFGDSVLETDLVGTWNLPTDGSDAGYSMSLTIEPDGAFVWAELDDTCGLVREGTGLLWVAGAQLVMLFETFDGLAPWPVVDQFGWDVHSPFLLRAGYAPVLAHVAVTAPPDLRVALPWASRGYARTVGGATAQDVWVSESELWAVAPGDTAATIIARDRHTLDIAGGPTAAHMFQRWWYEAGIQSAEPAIAQVLPYSDDLVGHLVLDGQAYTYVGSAMASYAPGDVFQLDAPSVCP